MGTKVTAGTPDIPYGPVGGSDYLPGSIGNTIVRPDILPQTTEENNGE